MCLQLHIHVQNIKTALGFCPVQPVGFAYFAQVKGELEGVVVQSIAAGRAHALAVTNTGQLYSWGTRGSVLGRIGDHRMPQRVFVDEKILSVAAGEVGYARKGRLLTKIPANLYMLLFPENFDQILLF